MMKEDTGVQRLTVEDLKALVREVLEGCRLIGVNKTQKHKGSGGDKQSYTDVKLDYECPDGVLTPDELKDRLDAKKVQKTKKRAKAEKYLKQTRKDLAKRKAKTKEK